MSTHGHTGLLIPHCANGQGLQHSGWCLTAGNMENSAARHSYGLFNFQAAKQVPSSSLTLHSQRRKTAAKPKPCTDDKKFRCGSQFSWLQWDLVFLWTSDGLNWPCCSWDDDSSCPWHNQLPFPWASTFLMASEGAGAEQEMAHCASQGKLTEWPCS